MGRDFHVDPHIAGEGETRRIDVAVAAVATRQHGVVSRVQLIALGLTRHEIDDRIRAGRLHPVHRGVYAVGHRRLSREGRYLAAVLAAGDGAVLSHCAAADLWDIRATKDGRIDVTVPAHRRGDAVLRTHQQVVTASETITRGGIPTTKPLRTILDLSACVPEHELERAIRQAVYRRLTSTGLLAEAVQQRPGQRGTRKLRNTLINLGEAPGLTRSELEEQFLRFLRRRRVPLPKLNQRMRIARKQIEADCVWPDQKLIVELDGRDAHDSTPAFESDRARDAALTAHGWRVVRVTSRRIRFDAAQLATELRALLA